MPKGLTWSNATSLTDLGLLTSAWLQGNGVPHPCGGNGPDPETADILSDLVLLNRRGLVTNHSQPARKINDTGTGQRAEVEGFTDERLARAIASLTLSTDLMVFLYEPGETAETAEYQVPITTGDFQPCTFCGVLCPEEVEYFSAPARAVLQEAWYVVVVDPKWGRSRYLWRHLKRVSRAGQNALWSFRT